ncbi:hypothetical protein [Azohydromonas lata]|uniref:hypothetical protein n=1 Tax=Azohydromonas lata TaxID=45677 RepID=UPI00082AA4CD|nr:hypothetical protein [Azohydromonas lata]
MTPNRTRSAVPLLILSLGFAVLMGAAAGMGKPAMLAPFLGLLALVGLFIVPSRLAFWTIFVVSMVIVGPVMYFGKLDSARWGPPLLALAMYIPLVAFIFKPRKPTVQPGWPLWVFVMVMFLIVAGCSTAMSSPRLGEVVVASRTYMAFWSVALAVGVGMLAPRDMLLAWKALLVVAIIQLPVAVYQYFVVAKASSRLSPWDAVVGTFPGNIEGGGASHGMGIFLLVAMAAVLTLWRAKRINRYFAAAVMVGILGSLALSEVKAAVLLVPAVFVLLFYRELLRRPMLSFGALLASVVLMGALFTVYATTFYAGRGMTLSGKMPTSPLQSIENQLNPEEVHTRDTGKGVVVSRAARMADWWSRSVRYGDPFHAMLGYGIGATQTSSIGMGELVPMFPYPLDMTGTTILLWETGALGHLLFMAALFMAGLNCNSSARSPIVPVEHKALLEAAGAGLIIFSITLPYSNFSLRAAPSQFVMVFMLGYSIYWWRVVRQAALARAGSVAPAAEVESGPKAMKPGFVHKQAAPRYRHG